LIAESLLVEAENALIKSLCEFMGIDLHPYGELREKMLDCALSICLAKIKEESR
jgi:hypothetical protein